ncbi:hypothetical protein E2C01_029619 [Portunus trituberculatus]|uniref:Uncharacterized protein n=1 Tax=Portunus trituberculatus TaxID=210409 RepID=A0A5B7ENV5_PORTR|nr:hypothetical protein [Portunus trituberculatus]
MAYRKVRKRTTDPKCRWLWNDSDQSPLVSRSRSRATVLVKATCSIKIKIKMVDRMVAIGSGTLTA